MDELTLTFPDPAREITVEPFRITEPKEPEPKPEPEPVEEPVPA